MIRADWLWRRHESRGRRALLLPLDGVAALYAAGALLHRGAYERGLLRRRQPACRVVSVGGLVVGGSGKTPVAAWLARELRRRGQRVALASRGYGRRAGRGDGVTIVSDGAHLCCSLDEAGDEPLLLAAQAPGVPVVVARRRAVAGLRAVSSFGAEVLVLDDGFQHHALARDVDILTVDGVGGFGNGRVLPRGPLREPLGALRRADAIGVVDGPLDDDDAARLRRLAPATLRFEARRLPAALRPLEGGGGECPRALAGVEVGLLAGIARPDAFQRTIEELGARVVAQRRFPDHHRYRPADLDGLERQAQLWVTTEKDAVKLRPEWAGTADLRVLGVALAVEQPAHLLEWIETRLRRAGGPRRALPT